MRSISAQSVSELGGKSSILARQKRDHVKLDGLLQRLNEVPADGQNAVLLDIYRLVFPHAFAEEAVLWPAIRRLLPEGRMLTLQVELEHQRINELVAELEALEPGSQAHQRVLVRVVGLLREDVRDEESELLPSLQAKLSASQLRLIGIVWEVVRAMAPTRAHPIVSRRPPGNVLSALPLALLDRARDLVDRRLQNGAGTAAPLLQAVGIALARVSRRIERLPGMTRGEDPATRIPVGTAGGWGPAAFLAAGAGSAALILAWRRRQRKIAA
ncbi:MAG TPA: hemerythrin domain-containing protein [Allosphingosinicella sp.]|nr:hemerythrin domain-containing protein [Allosphingosinicella sp.]